jgi:hypothetical protein
MSSFDIPSVMDISGLQPQTPANLRARLLTSVAARVPGYTATLPGSLIEDISSTDVGALLLCDSFRVELVNSITPWGANEFLLNQLGNIYGTTRSQTTNTSVKVVFSGTPNTLIPKGFLVTDGIYQYATQVDAIIGTSGSSLPVFCVATITGTWPVAVGTVDALASASPPGAPAITVNNPTTGTPGAGTESLDSYRQRVLRAGLATSQGMPGRLRTLLSNVPGINQRLVAIRQQNFPPGGWTIIAGGGDPYQTALAILRGLFDVSTLMGSIMEVVNITQANPGVVTTFLNHGYQNGETVTISSIMGMIELNGVLCTVTVIDEKSFSIGIDTRTYPPYAGRGVVSPNPRNIVVSINDFPDVYQVVYVDPPQQSVAVVLTWNTDSPNFISPAAFAQLAVTALVNYINGVTVGQPMNLFEMQNVVQSAVSSILPIDLLSRMVFSVSIDGVGITPETGTGIVAGDPESYFLTNGGLITITQG